MPWPESAATSVVQLNQSSGHLVEQSANDDEGSQNPATRFSSPESRPLLPVHHRLLRRMRAAAPRSAAAAASASASQLCARHPPSIHRAQPRSSDVGGWDPPPSEPM